jgi:hypothetical protein
MPPLTLARRHAIAFRLAANDLTTRLPSGSHATAARQAIQDTYPRSALISLHARVEDCESAAWEDARLIQTYSPRAAVHVLPVADWAVFTVGRLPLDPGGRRQVEIEADRAVAALAGQEVRGNAVPEGIDVRAACASGRIAVRWDARLTWYREVPAPEVDLDETRRELCRRHVHAFGPTTPEAFAWWAGLPVGDGHQVWATLLPELVEVDLEGHQAWILAADEERLRSALPAPGVRLLPAEELRLFGADRHGLFAGPMRKVDWSTADTHHPHPLVVNGELAGAWGRRGGRVTVKPKGWLSDELRARIEVEALAMPIPKATMSVRFVEPGTGETVR